MKKIVIVSIIATLGFVSCDKVDNAYPSLPSTDLDYGLYPGGGQADYEATEWPTFGVNANANRNVLVEDFTGHRCVFCPPAADLAKTLEEDNIGRVYSTAIHTGPEPYNANWNGVAPGDFQTVVPPIYGHNFANDEGLKIGDYFGTAPGSAFVGNPRGTVSRIKDGSNQPTLGPADWTSAVNAALTTNDLKVNIQSAKNYYPSTRGLFLHTEIEILDASITNELRTVVYLIEDSIVSPQSFPGGIDSLTYVHREIMRGCIDARTFGQVIDTNSLDANGKYYFNYSYALPPAYNATNMHLLIYVRDAFTDEIYHVIKEVIE